MLPLVCACGFNHVNLALFHGFKYFYYHSPIYLAENCHSVFSCLTSVLGLIKRVLIFRLELGLAIDCFEYYFWLISSKMSLIIIEIHQHTFSTIERDNFQIPNVPQPSSYQPVRFPKIPYLFRTVALTLPKFILVHTCSFLENQQQSQPPDPAYSRCLGGGDVQRRLQNRRHT